MTQHVERSTRRRFLRRIGVAGAGGLLGLRSDPAAAEPPPETTKLRLLESPVICLAPQYVAEHLLRTEGFAEVNYVKYPQWNEALASGEVDISLWHRGWEEKWQIGKSPVLDRFSQPPIHGTRWCC